MRSSDSSRYTRGAPPGPAGSGGGRCCWALLLGQVHGQSAQGQQAQSLHEGQGVQMQRARQAPVICWRGNRRLVRIFSRSHWDACWPRERAASQEHPTHSAPERERPLSRKRRDRTDPMIQSARRDGEGSYGRAA